MTASRLHRICDSATEIVLYAAIVFGPWAFGTTQLWSTRTLNVAGFVLGALWLTKVATRRITGYHPARWDWLNNQRPPWWPDLFVTRILALLTVTFLLYVFVSAINARAIYVHSERYFDYLDYIPWLPHSYDRDFTWRAFWRYLALAGTFWAMRDWLLTISRDERAILASEGILASGDDPRASNRTPAADPGADAMRALLRPEAGTATAGQAAIPTFDAQGNEVGRGIPTATAPALRRRGSDAAQILPARLRRLLWVLCINGALLAIEGMLQRFSGTNKLLWILKPHINVVPQAQFGPYAYRSNAAQYLNLIWPMCLGFWWLMRHGRQRADRNARRMGDDPHVMLLPCAILMGAAPVISTSRGGALVALVAALASVVILIVANRGRHWLGQLGIVTLFVAMVGLGLNLGWKELGPRFRTMFTDNLSNRTEIYTNTVQIAKDYPLYGTGAGSFGAIYQLYRSGPGQLRHAYVHNDWLETRATLGWVGLALLVSALALTGFRAVGRSGIAVEGTFLALLWVGLAGCLAHARFDFPFQIYSVLHLFVLQASLLSCITYSRR